MNRFDVIQEARTITDHVIVAFSGGKDSIACMDLCRKYFKRVDAFWMYVINGLSFHEQYLSYVERRYDVKIARVPSWALTERLRGSVYRWQTSKSEECPAMRVGEIYNAMRRKFGCQWIVTGEKKADSLQRRGQMWHAQQAGMDGVEQKRHLIWPLANWVDKDVYSYLKRQRIPLPPDYAMLCHSYQGDLYPETLIEIRKRFPADYEIIRKKFPFVQAAMVRHALQERDAAEQDEIPEVRGSDDPPEPAQGSAVQPSNPRQARAKKAPRKHQKERAC